MAIFFRKNRCPRSTRAQSSHAGSTLAARTSRAHAPSGFAAAASVTAPSLGRTPSASSSATAASASGSPCLRIRRSESMDWCDSVHLNRNP